MSSLLASIILSVCAPNVGVEDLRCEDFFVNCAVGKAGKIDEKSIDECLKKWESHEKYSTSTGDSDK